MTCGAAPGTSLALVARRASAIGYAAEESSASAGYWRMIGQTCSPVSLSGCDVTRFRFKVPTCWISVTSDPAASLTDSFDCTLYTRTLGT